MKIRCFSHTRIDEDYLTKLMCGPVDFRFVKGVQSSEGLVSYCASIGGANKEQLNYVQLLKKHIDSGNLELFDMVDMAVEIVASKATVNTLLKDKTFRFFETPQANNPTIEICTARGPSSVDLPQATKDWFDTTQLTMLNHGYDKYKESLSKGISEECASLLLPLNTRTNLFMKGSLRSWINYVNVNKEENLQLEQLQIIDAIKQILTIKYPAISEALELTKGSK